MLVAAYATVYLAIRTPHLAALTDVPLSHWAPVGVAHLLPPEHIGAGIVWLVSVITVAFGAAVTVGWRHRVTGPGLAIGLVVLMSYRNSFGQVFHTEHLLVLHVLVLALGTEVVSTASLDARRSGRRPLTTDGWQLRLMGVLTVLTYVIAGVTKLRNSGLGWVDGETLRNWIAYDNLRKIELGDVHSPLGGWLVTFDDVVFVPIAIATLAVELAAPLALVSLRWALRWAVAAWLFHVGVVAVMAIVFPYPLLGIAYVCLLQAERLPGASWAVRRLSAPEAGSEPHEDESGTYIRT